MDIAKSLFGSRAPEGYAGKEDFNEKVDTAISEDEGDSYLQDVPEGVSVLADGLSPTPGGPFSALTPSMWPQEILTKLGQPEDPNSQPDYRFDEFGFRVEEEDGPEQNSNKLLGIPFVEDPQHRLQWVAYLEFNQNKEVCDLTWDKVEVTLPRTEKLRAMVRAGIPHSLRPPMWMRLSGALQKKLSAKTSYKEVVRASSNDALMTSKQIEKDLLRTLPGNACFSHPNSTGIPRLRRVLRSLAWLYPDIGYCQGTGMMAAALLLLMEEEDTFWMMCAIVEDLLPASYYSSTLIGIQADQHVLRSLIANYLPDVDAALSKHDMELSLITLHWFLTLFASVVHMKVLLRIWDLLFLDGSIILFKVTLGMLKIKEPALKNLENSAQIFNVLSDIPGDIDDVDNLVEVSMNVVASSLSDVSIDTHRRRHLAYLMADAGALVGNPDAALASGSSINLPKQHLSRRQVKKSKSMLQVLLFGDEDGEEDIKSKNIRQTGVCIVLQQLIRCMQVDLLNTSLLGFEAIRLWSLEIITEILVDLREAILQVARHFISTDPNLQQQSSKVILTPDYSMESHKKDLESYLSVSRNRHRRAKALLDFERHDDDELGFRKNDIITIISQKDEHCWIGELNGLRGWFPAKFVELLDERSKQYSCAGDDSVSQAVTDLVRGTLCPAIKQVLEHGMKRPTFLGGTCHPWLFIEEAASKEIERDFESVYSRLVLCKTYRLDEDGKVLTPEELLYRCVQAINLTHDTAHAQMDVKLRSLICLGLNEQVLHLWLEVLCSCVPVVQKWFHPWSFVCSPGWVQVKCELRVLSQFAFSLSPDWELPPHTRRSHHSQQLQPLKDGVRDMLVKHHLFSWDL